MSNGQGGLGGHHDRLRSDSAGPKEGKFSRKDGDGIAEVGLRKIGNPKLLRKSEMDRGTVDGGIVRGDLNGFDRVGWREGTHRDDHLAEESAGRFAGVFVTVWTDPVIWPLIGIAFTLTIVSIFAAMILLDSRENTFCVPLERSSSLLAGIVAAFLLHGGWNHPAPTGMELIGASLLIAAIVLLTVAPHLSKRSIVR